MQAFAADASAGGGLGGRMVRPAATARFAIICLTIDVRPSRRQGSEPGPLTHRSPDYDREATCRLIGAFQATGQVDKIYFNDPDIGIKGVTPWPDHDNHLHFQLKR